jgi:hypothetical protein
MSIDEPSEITVKKPGKEIEPSPIKGYRNTKNLYTLASYCSE